MRISMKDRQYELNMVKQVAKLGTSPTARGAIDPLARIAKQPTYHYFVRCLA